MTIRADIDMDGIQIHRNIPVCILNGHQNGDGEVGAKTLRLYVHLNLVIWSVGRCTFQGMIHTLP